MNLPAAFTRNLVEVHGDKGRQWIKDFPGLIAHCRTTWNLTDVGKPFALSYNYVVPVLRADGAPAVLKLGIPGDPEFVSELDALAVFNGDGAVRVLETDAERAAMLLERVIPGTPLRRLLMNDDDQATHIAASVMQKLWKPPPADVAFRTVAQWGEAFARVRAQFDGTSGPFSAALFARAENLYAELSASMGEVVVLHGDLHYDNILESDRGGWLAIDPKGIVGERAYEVGALLTNHEDQFRDASTLKRTLARRANILSEDLDIDKERVVGWALAQAVLSSIWTLEDHGRVGEFTLQCAGALDEIR